MEEVFNKYFSNDDLLLFRRSQKARVDLQHYSDRNLTEDTLKSIRKNRAVFLVKCKSILLTMNNKIIKGIREDLISNVIS